MTAGSVSEFEVGIRGEAGRVIAALRGEVDLLTAPTLQAVLDGVVEHGHLDVVLDMRDLQFLGAAGLGVIAEIADRVRTRRGQLSVRSAPAFTLKLLASTGLSDIVHFETSDPQMEHLGREQTGDVHGWRAGRKSVDLVSDLVRVGSMLSSTAVVDRALQLVTVLAQATIDRADGVSVSLERQGRVSTVAWTNDTVLHMDLHQYQTGEGPCLDAMTTGHWLHIESLVDEDRWPAFVPLAVQEGISSILSTPLTTSNTPVGALNIYSNSEGAFGPPQLDLLGLFAEQASGIITSNISSADAADRLGHALIDRELIAQAQGVLMARSVVHADEAAATLFRSARTAQITVIEQAAAVVASTRTGAGPPA